jgi:hypothetical protein
MGPVMVNGGGKVTELLYLAASHVMEEKSVILLKAKIVH